MVFVVVFEPINLILFIVKIDKDGTDAKVRVSVLIILILPAKSTRRSI